MVHRWAVSLTVLIVLGSQSLLAATEKIEVPEEELAQETVLPVFDRVQVVKNRNRTTEGRFEFGGGLGFNLTEAIYSNQNFNLWGSYHFTETHGVTGTYFMIQGGLSSMGEDLKNGKGIKPDAVDASLAPEAESLLLGDYQFTAYYGKISLSKDTVLNLSVYGLAGLGLMSFSDSSAPAFDLGVGQKLYFGDRLGLRIDLRIIAYQGPNIADEDERLVPGTGEVSSSELDKILYFHTYLNVGLVFAI